MKDRLGHGSDPRGAHTSGVDTIGQQPMDVGIAKRPEGAAMQKLVEGTLRQTRYPNEITSADHFYHGTRGEFVPGALIESGHPGNFVRRMKHVYMTQQPEGSPQYKGARGYGERVYEVQPTGPIGHRRDAKGVEWASEFPLRVIREVKRTTR